MDSVNANSLTKLNILSVTCMKPKAVTGRPSAIETSQRQTPRTDRAISHAMKELHRGTRNGWKWWSVVGGKFGLELVRKNWNFKRATNKIPSILAVLAPILGAHRVAENQWLEPPAIAKTVVANSGPGIGISDATSVSRVRKLGRRSRQEGNPKIGF